ncbi:MAG: epoxyqueuosine reductase QueH [Chloroflexi bacterium]|nr:epoxyqueuosine reductase QueH [Chloroflexota bacterium]
MPSVLLHTCCGPCAISVVKTLRGEGFQATGLWYNPNIHPFTEHQRRLEAMQTVAKVFEMPLIVAEGYDLVEYIRRVVGHESQGERCRDCFRMRLEKTAAIARQKRIEFITTTLLISPYQSQDLLQEVGEQSARDHGVKFLFQDFRHVFRESHRLSKEMGLYHQGYCGCVYSEWERYGKTRI